MALNWNKWVLNVPDVPNVLCNYNMHLIFFVKMFLLTVHYCVEIIYVLILIAR